MASDDNWFFQYRQDEFGVRCRDVRKLRGSGPPLLDVAGWPRLRPADVGDEVRHLCGRGRVWGYGEHGVLARDGADNFEPLHPVEDAGDGAGSPVAGVDDDLVLSWREAEDETG